MQLRPCGVRSIMREGVRQMPDADILRQLALVHQNDWLFVPSVLLLVLYGALVW